MRRLISAVAVCVAATTLHAATKTWTRAVDNRWSVAGNWQGGVPQPLDRLVFPAGVEAGNMINDLPADMAFGEIVSSASGFTVGGNRLVLTGGVRLQTASASFNAPVRVDATQTLFGASPTPPTTRFAGAIAVNGQTLTIDGLEISGSGITGGGTLILRNAAINGSHSFSGTTTVAADSSIDGTLAGGPITVQSGATLGGSGTVGNLVVNGTIRPGGSPPYDLERRGTMNTGSLTFNATGRYRAQLDGLSSDRVNVTGTVALNGAVLEVVADGCYFGSEPELRIIDNDGTDPVSGTFAGMPEGFLINVPNGTCRVRLGYAGGDGNDVVLKVEQTLTRWTGAVNGLWSEPGNWDGHVPSTDYTIQFPDFVPNKANTNDLQPFLTFRQIDISHGYTINGNPFGITKRVQGAGRGDGILMNPVQARADNAELSTLTLGGSFDPNGHSVRITESDLTGSVVGTGSIATRGSRFSGNSSFTGTMRVESHAFVTGTFPGTIETAIDPDPGIGGTGGQLFGTGIVGDVNDFGQLYPGGTLEAGDTPGILTTGNLFVSEILGIQILGAAAGSGYDRVNVHGSVTLAPATSRIVVSIGPGFTPAIGDVFVIVNNDGSDPVSGHFRLLPEGASVPGTNPLLRISYVGGDGNDITLTAVSGLPTVRHDYEGDGIADFGVFRMSDADWHITMSSGGYLMKHAPFFEGARVVPGVFDRDGRMDFAWFYPSGLWKISTSSGVDRDDSVFPTAGEPGDIPVPADYDGDGIDDIAIFRPGQGGWYIKLSGGGSQQVVGWGMVPTDVPVPADYDGDGKADIAIFRRSEGGWHILRSSGGTTTILGWGFADNDVPVPADYDGDGRTDIAIFRPIEGGWHIIRSSAGNYTLTGFGVVSGDIPVPADYDGDGKDDIAVFRPIEGGWHVAKSSGGFFSLLGWGMHPSDIPLTKAPRP